MAQLDPRNWMEVLPEEECWRLLEGEPIARLAVSGPDGPEIFPMNIVVDRRSVVFRTDPGSKLASIASEPRVTLEADWIDVEQREGWSVVVAGRVTELGGADLLAAQELPLHPWTIGDKARWFRLSPVRVSGRAIGLRASRGSS